MKTHFFCFQNKLPHRSTILFAIVMLLLFSFNTGAVKAQDTTIVSALSPRDTLTVIDSASMAPAIPSYGIIQDWVSVHIIKDINVTRYKSYIYSGLGFRLLYPEAYKGNNIADNDSVKGGRKTYPMTIFLHGMGEKGKVEENEACLRYVGKAFLAAESEGKFQSYALIPQSQSGYWSPDDLQKIISITKYMIEKNHVDPMRISVMGISLGADGAWRLAASDPNLFSLLIDLSAADLSYLKDIPKMKYLPVVIVQGSYDRKPDPALSLKIANSLKLSDGISEYLLLKKTGHNTLVPMLLDPSLYARLAGANKLNPARHGSMIGICPGFPAYRWFLNGVLLNGTNHNLIGVLKPGFYSVQVKQNGQWSEKSPIPLKIEK